MAGPNGWWLRRYLIFPFFKKKNKTNGLQQMFFSFLLVGISFSFSFCFFLGTIILIADETRAGKRRRR